MKNQTAKTGTEFEQKQKEIDAQHKATVNKIKSEIWGDRLVFLQKMIKLADEGKEDAPAAPTPQPAQKVSVMPKAQALAQESTKGKTQEDEDASNKKKTAEPKPKKKEKAKKDLIHRIDQ